MLLSNNQNKVVGLVLIGVCLFWLFVLQERVGEKDAAIRISGPTYHNTIYTREAQEQKQEQQQQEPQEEQNQQHEAKSSATSITAIMDSKLKASLLYSSDLKQQQQQQSENTAGVLSLAEEQQQQPQQDTITDAQPLTEPTDAKQPLLNVPPSETLVSSNTELLEQLPSPSPIVTPTATTQHQQQQTPPLASTTTITSSSTATTPPTTTNTSPLPSWKDDHDHLVDDDADSSSSDDIISNEHTTTATTTTTAPPTTTTTTTTTTIPPPITTATAPASPYPMDRAFLRSKSGYISKAPCKSSSTHHMISVLPCDAVAVGEEISIFGVAPSTKAKIDETPSRKLFCVFDFDPQRIDFKLAGVGEPTSSIWPPFGDQEMNNCQRTLMRPKEYVGQPLRYYAVPDGGPSVVVSPVIWSDEFGRVHRCRVPSIPSTYLPSSSTLIKAVVTIASIRNSPLIDTIFTTSSNSNNNYTLIATNKNGTSWDGWGCKVSDNALKTVSVIKSAADLTIYTGDTFDQIRAKRAPSGAGLIPRDFAEAIHQLHGSKKMPAEDAVSRNNEANDIDESEENTCELGICTMIRNEPTIYIKQWIEYNRLLGIKHFFLYDNNSTIPLRQALAEYIDDAPSSYTSNSTSSAFDARRKPVTVHVTDWNIPYAPQHSAFSHCLERYGTRGHDDYTVTASTAEQRKRYKFDKPFYLKRYYDPLHAERVRARGGVKCEWLAFIDVDEYLVFSLDRIVKRVPSIVPSNTDKNNNNKPIQYDTVPYINTHLEDDRFLQYLRKVTLYDLRTLFTSNKANSNYVNMIRIESKRFGYNNYVHPPNGLIIENYRTRADEVEKFPKSIIHRRTFATLDHYIHYWGFQNYEHYAFLEGDRVIPLPGADNNKPLTYNHYSIKSWDDALRKNRRARTGGAFLPKINETRLQEFEAEFARREAAGLPPQWPPYELVENGLVLSGMNLIARYMRTDYSIRDDVAYLRYGQLLKCAMHMEQDLSRCNAFLAPRASSSSSKT